MPGTKRGQTVTMHDEWLRVPIVSVGPLFFAFSSLSL